MLIDRIGRARVELVTGFAVQAFGTVLGAVVALWLLLAIALGTGLMVGLAVEWYS